MRFENATRATAVAIVISLVTACSFFNAAPSECVAAAEDAGLPGTVIDQLKNPEGLNALERAALQQALNRARIDDLCQDEVNRRSSTDPTDAEQAQTETASNGGRDNEQPSSGDEVQNRAGATEQPRLESRTGQTTTDDYGECLDDVFLRAASDYDTYHWLSAAVWYCRHLEPQSVLTSNSARCRLDQIDITAQRYPEWNEILHYWYAMTACDPRPTADATHIGRGSSITPTRYSAYLDNAFLAYTEMLGDDELEAGVSAWLCQDYLPEPPETHRLRCDLNQQADTGELYPEWPEELHQWHAIMQCLPEWQPHAQTNEDIYSTCLGDTYAQVVENYDKQAAIPAAVWRCKSRMPEPPAIYNPRCEVNQLKRAEENELDLPGELYAWNAIVQCYPTYE